MKEKLEGKIIKIVSKGFVKSKHWNKLNGSIPVTYLIMKVNDEEVEAGLPAHLDFETEGESFKMEVAWGSFPDEELYGFNIIITSGERQGFTYNSGYHHQGYSDIKGSEKWNKFG